MKVINTYILCGIFSKTNERIMSAHHNEEKFTILYECEGEKWVIKSDVGLIEITPSKALEILQSNT